MDLVDLNAKIEAEPGIFHHELLSPIMEAPLPTTRSEKHELEEAEKEVASPPATYSRKNRVLYSGSVIHRFVCDRIALGLSDDELCAEFNALFGVPLSPGDVDRLRGDSEFNVQLQLRRNELSEFVRSSSFLERLVSLDLEIKEARETALTKKDIRTYVRLIDSALKSLELFLKTIKSFERKDAPQNVVVLQQNNFLALSELERDGLISIHDRSSLKRLFNVSDDSKEAALDDASAFV